MRQFLFAVLLVVACATVAAAGPIEEAKSAYGRSDYALAERLFRPLAEQGDAKAQFYLGWVYYMGRRVPQDAQEAVKWYRKAAEQGLVRAQLNLALMYETGQGAPQDFVRAHMWLNVAAAASKGDDVKTAIKNQNKVASQMTTAQIGKAQDMAQHCRQSQFKECD